MFSKAQSQRLGNDKWNLLDSPGHQWQTSDSWTSGQFCCLKWSNVVLTRVCWTGYVMAGLKWEVSGQEWHKNTEPGLWIKLNVNMHLN